MHLFSFDILHKYPNPEPLDWQMSLGKCFLSNLLYLHLKPTTQLDTDPCFSSALNLFMFYSQKVHVSLYHIDHKQLPKGDNDML